MIPSIPPDSNPAQPRHTAARRTACRFCGAPLAHTVIDLGAQPPCNSMISRERFNDAEAFYPLTAMVCDQCYLVQLETDVAPDSIYTEYAYFSSFSDSWLDHARRYVDAISYQLKLAGDHQVVELASNDGYLLQRYHTAGVPVLGIEPATNIARVAREERGIPTLGEFFGPTVAADLSREGKQADVIHANNVLAHVPDLNGFVKGLQLLLKDKGVAVIEVPYVKDMIDRTEFDTIYHEHLCYFSLTALDQLFRRHGLAIQDVERMAIHGGTLRLYAVKEGTADEHSSSGSAQQLLEMERLEGVDGFEFYRGFGEKVEQLRNELVTLLHSLKADGKRIAVYGASAKGATLLNYFGIGRETLDYVADRSTAKQGYYTPGTHLPIYPPEHLLETMPDYVLLLTWNFADEILQQQSEYRRRGGRFIIPIPNVRVIESTAATLG